MREIYCIPLLSDPVHMASAQAHCLLTMASLQEVENDNARKSYVPSSFQNFCPSIKTLNHIESDPVKIFVMNILYVFCLRIICVV